MANVVNAQSPQNKCTWHVDSGAGRTLTGNRDLFMAGSLRSLTSPINVRFGGSLATVPAIAIGTITIRSALILGGLVLENALYVPQSYVNLIGVQVTCESLDCEIVFTAKKCKITRAGLGLCEIPANKGGTYTIDANSACVFRKCTQHKSTPQEAFDASVVALQQDEAQVPAVDSHRVPNTTSLLDPVNRVQMVHRRLGHPSRGSMLAMSTLAQRGSVELLFK